MGNICSGKHQKQQTNQTVDTFNRNFVFHSYLVKKVLNVDLIIGTYQCHKSETLLAIVQKQYLDYCTELRDYGSQIQQTMAQILTQQSKLVTTVPINKECHYKKLQICVLPTYIGSQEEKEIYMIQFENACKQIFNGSSDITIQLTHTSQNSNGLPNQILMSIFMRTLEQNLGRTSNKQKKRLTVIANDAKLLNLVRFQIVKLQNYQINKSKLNSPQKKGIYGYR